MPRLYSLTITDRPPRIDDLSTWPAASIIATHVYTLDPIVLAVAVALNAPSQSPNVAFPQINQATTIKLAHLRPSQRTRANQTTKKNDQPGRVEIYRVCTVV